MLSPNCRSATRVLESRHADEGVAIRRRRECPACRHRFTTYERREPPPLHVRKRDGRRERFDRVKLRDGMVRAAYKRPVEGAEIDAIVDRISYLQFASVYRQLADVEDVQAELARLGADQGSHEPQEASLRARVPSDSDASIPSPSRRPERAGQR